MLEDVLVFAAVGFAAQMIDGAIGMAYGLSATSVLLSLGVSPTTASASVHAAEVFTTGASGLAHWRLGNVRRDLVLRLAVPGALGGVLGASVLVGTPTGAVRVFVSLYLLALGGVILRKALRPLAPEQALQREGEAVAPALALQLGRVAQPGDLHHPPLAHEGGVAVPGTVGAEEGEDVALLRTDLGHRVSRLPPRRSTRIRPSGEAQPGCR